MYNRNRNNIKNYDLTGGSWTDSIVKKASNAMSAINAANQRDNALNKTNTRLNKTPATATASAAHQIPMHQSVISTPQDLKCSALVSVQARYVKPHVIIQVPVEYLINNPPSSQLVKARQLQKNTMVNVTQGELKPASVVTVRATDVHPEAVIQVPAGAVHPNTLVHQTSTGMATLSSLTEDPSKIKSLKGKLITVLPSTVHPMQVVKVSAQEVLNLNANVRPVGSMAVLPLADALNQGMSPNFPVTVFAKHVNPAAPVQVPPQTVQVNRPVGLTAGQLDRNTLIAATQPALPPDLLVAVKAKDINPTTIVVAPSQAIKADTSIYPPQKIQSQTVGSLEANANVNAMYPVSVGVQQMHTTRADQVPSAQTVQAKPSALVSGTRLKVPAHMLKPTVRVTHGTGTFMTENAQRMPMGAGQVSAVNPDLSVFATKEELNNTPVMVNHSAILPSQQKKVIQISPSRSLANPRQLKTGVHSVQVQNVNPTVPLQLNANGVYNTPLAFGQTGQADQTEQTGQTGGSGSDYAGSFYANTVLGGPAAISAATLQGIDNAPMFHPLDPLAVVPTLPSTGIFPTGMEMAMEGAYESLTPF